MELLIFLMIASVGLSPILHHYLLRKGTFMKTLSCLLALCLIFAPTVQAGSVYCTNCSNTAMQNLQHAVASQQLTSLKQSYDQYVEQTAKQLAILQENIKQYDNMLQNTAQLPANLIKDVSQNLQKLSAITGQLNTLKNDIQGMANVFDTLYRTQDEFKDLANLPKELLSSTGEKYNQYWDNWSQRVDESTRATFQLSANQLKELENSGQLQSYINSLLTTPDGQQKALMAGNQLAALQIQESRELRELIATKFQSDLATQEKDEKIGQYQQEVHRKMVDSFKNIDAKKTSDPF